MIYRLAADTTNYMLFAFDDFALLDKMSDFDVSGFGTPLKFEWNTPQGMFLRSGSGSISLPDITLWAQKALILNEKAKEALTDSLKSEGEFYDINIEGSKYWVFNSTQIKGNDVIDKANSEAVYLEDGEFLGVKRISFSDDANKIKSLIFGIEFDHNASLFSGEAFKSLIKEKGLSGLEFSDNYVPYPCDDASDIDMDVGLW